jgi:hypothetical protein
MRQRSIYGGILWSALTIAGCSNSSTPPSRAEGPAVSESAGAAEDRSFDTVLQGLDTGRPEAVVSAFLTALRDGDKQTAAALLTSKAREETAKHDLVVQPPGTPSAQFSVGDVAYIDADATGAHVKSLWSDASAATSGALYEIVWALRRQQDGWRIAGMATEIIAGQQPVFLNFEDPHDMLERWQHAEEIATRNQRSNGDSPTVTR